MKVKTIAVVGANGDLGSRICKYLSQNGVLVIAIVRKSSNINSIKNIPNININRIDYDNFNELVNVFDGLSCVICTISGLDDVIIKTQTIVLDAAEKAQVEKFIPSDFAVDFRNIPENTNRNLELRKKFKIRLDSSTIKITSILNGVFSDMLVTVMPLILYKIRRVVYFQNPDQKIDFTTIETTAQYTALAALDENSPRYLQITTDELSSRDFVDMMSNITGKKYKLLNGGNLKMLKLYIFLAKLFSFDKNALYPAWQGMQYFYTLFSGVSKFDKLDNDRYKQVNWVKAEGIISNYCKKVQ